MDHIKLGYAPTRRSIFSAPDAVKYRGLTADRLRELGIDFVDITDINEEGLLYDDEGMYKIAEKFKREKIDGLFLPHCNFGTEFECARLAKELGVPVLLWGPLDERPDENGVRLRDTQCGLFATGKVLRRFRVSTAFTVLEPARRHYVSLATKITHISIGCCQKSALGCTSASIKIVIIRTNFLKSSVHHAI